MFIHAYNNIQHTLAFNSCHKFSIGFASGLSGGVFHQLIDFSAKKVCAWREVCLGSLSCMNLCPVGYTTRMNRTRYWSSMLVYIGASIIPSTTHPSVHDNLSLHKHGLSLGA